MFNAIGNFCLLVACASVLGGLLSGIAACTPACRKPETRGLLMWAVLLCTGLACAALTVCCLVIVVCLFSGDVSIAYVVEERSNSADGLRWLYLLSGLWAGSKGSLLFWAWLISAFAFYTACRHSSSGESVDAAALSIQLAVLGVFSATLLFSEDMRPFVPTDASYFDSNGELTLSASVLGMNPLLEHWAMAIHPPTLFIGYAGMTVPFSYALGALLVGDDSCTWVERANGVTAFSWLFLGAGIGLGAVWAYVVLGWGGYWGWDPVENASLLSWLCCVALMHSFTVYRKHGAFKRWSVVAACLCFMFVIVGTFIARSGIVQSVHAFQGDTVSAWLFGALIVVSALSALAGALARPKSFGQVKGEADAGTPTAGARDGNGAVAPTGASGMVKGEGAAGAGAPEGAAADAASADGAAQDASLLNLEFAYFLNNLVMIASSFLLAYLTVASALPSWMPLGGQSVPSSMYAAIARPLGIVFLAIVAVAPLLGWHKTEGKRFWRRLRAPGLAALAVFAVLVAYWALCLLPAYDAQVAAGGSAAEDLLAAGPAIYCHAIAIAAFAVASLLLCTSLSAFGRAVSALRGAGARKAGVEKPVTLAQLAQAGAPARPRRSPRAFLPRVGGMLAHAGLAIILVGLVGSSMYVTEKSGYLAAGEDSQAAAEMQIGSYTVSPVEATVEDRGDGYLYRLELQVQAADGTSFTMAPSIYLDAATSQQKYDAAVAASPGHDLFVVYRGVNEDGDYSVELRVNPLISFVWAGFTLLMIGTATGLFASRRRPREKATAPAGEKASMPVGEKAAPEAGEPALAGGEDASADEEAVCAGEKPAPASDGEPS